MRRNEIYVKSIRFKKRAKNFIAIAYLRRLSRLENLPAHPFAAAAAVREGSRVPHKTA